MQRARLGSLVVFVTILIAMGSFLGCSQQTRYKALTFFFDGVPSPDRLSAMDAEGQRIAYLHKPYAEGKCGFCHGSDDIEMSIARPTNIADIPSTVCLKCHENVRSGYPVMHGPVAAAECMQCHAPHQSADARLLRGTAPKLCAQCHTPETMRTDVPEHHDMSADCLSCHSGHGGTNHNLLRAGYPATQPAVSATPVQPGGTSL